MLCASHGRVVRKQLTDSRKQAEKKKMLLSRPKSVQKPIKKVSDKRKVLNAEYSILRDQFLKAHDKCEMKLLGCTEPSNEVHHTHQARIRPRTKQHLHGKQLVLIAIGYYMINLARKNLEKKVLKFNTLN
jgi:hypothetical protein